MNDDRYRQSLQPKNDRDALFIELFSRLMLREMVDNSHKGDWIGMTFMDLAHELAHHQAKLLRAMNAMSQTNRTRSQRLTIDFIAAQDAVLEYAADCGNIAMMAAVIAGEMQIKYAPRGVVSDDLAKQTDRMSTLLVEAEQLLTYVENSRHMPRAAWNTFIDDGLKSLLPRIRNKLAAVLKSQTEAVEREESSHEK